jgi:hypothetical protein
MPLTAFHLFPALPKELRDDIWLAALAPELLPRAFFFTLKVRRFSTLHGRVRGVFLLPGWDLFLRGDTTLLARSTAASRTLGFTCREARAVVHRALPDRLPFRLVSCVVDVDADPAEDAEYFLRFDGERDVVVIKEHQSTLENAAHWLVETGRGDSFAQFEAIKNLAMDAVGLNPYDLNRVAPREYCYCGKGYCYICGVDALPRFLACFPRLRTFYAAEVKEYYYATVDSRRMRTKSVDMCACAADGEGDGERPQHEWPLVRAIEGVGHWLISHREGECSFPPLGRLEMVRRDGILGWPCRYEGLRHLEFRILRRFKGGPPVPRWERAED